MFKFRLQRILDLRAQKEQQVAARLGAAQAEEARHREHCDELEVTRQRGIEQIGASQGGPLAVGQLQNLRFTLDRLGEQIRMADEYAQLAAKRVEEIREEYNEAFRERRVLEKLRERELAAWRAQEARKDQQDMDSIALTRYVRADAGPMETGSDQ